MNFLRIKSIVYRYTGIYLAYREEVEYLNSRAFRKEFDRSLKHFDDTHPLDVQGILIGMWQSKHHFYRNWVDPKGKSRLQVAILTSWRTLVLDLDLLRLRCKRRFLRKKPKVRRNLQ